MHFRSSAARVALALVVLSVLGGGVTAQDSQPPWAADTGAQLLEIAADHNAVAEQLNAGPVATLLRDERVTLFVSDTDGSEAVFSFRTDERLRLVELREGARTDATTHLFTDRATLSRIADAPDRGSAFEAAVRNGDIRVVGVSPLNRAVWGLIGLALWALASPGQAAAAAVVTAAGVGAVVLVGSKVIGGGTLAAGSASASAGASTSAGVSATAGATGTSAAGSGVGTAGTSAAGSGVGTAGTSAAGSGVGTTGTTAAGGAESSTMLAQTAGNTLEAGQSLSTGSVNPVSIADRILSFFERLLFIVAIVKKLGGRIRRRLGGVGDRLLGRGSVDDAVTTAEAITEITETVDPGDASPTLDAVSERARSPSRRRRPSPRRRRR